MDLFNFEDRLKDEFEHDQGDNFVQNYVGVLNTPPHPPYDDTDEYLNYVDGGDKLEKISVSEENKTVFMSELTEFSFDHTAGDKTVVTARDAEGLKYKGGREEMNDEDVDSMMKEIDEMEKISMSDVNNDVFMGELTEFGFEHTAGDKPVVTAKDAKDLKYKMIAELDMSNLKDDGREKMNDDAIMEEYEQTGSNIPKFNVKMDALGLIVRSLDIETGVNAAKTVLEDAMIVLDGESGAKGEAGVRKWRNEKGEREERCVKEKVEKRKKKGEKQMKLIKVKDKENDDKENYIDENKEDKKGKQGAPKKSKNKKIYDANLKRVKNIHVSSYTSKNNNLHHFPSFPGREVSHHPADGS